MTAGKIKDYFLFMTGLLGAFTFRIVGTFYGVEIIAILSYFFISWRVCTKNFKVIKFILMSFLWLSGAIIADIWNQSETEPALKGIFNIVFFIVQIPFVYWALYDKLTRWIYFYTGYAISTVLNFYFFHMATIESEEAVVIWKFYAWTQFVVAIAAIFYYRGYHNLSYIIAIGLGVVGLFNGSRNMFLTLSVASIILFFIDRIKGKDITHRILRFRHSIPLLALSLFFGAIMIDDSYEYLASTGKLGDAAYDKYMEQKYSSLGLASGRGEFIVGAEFVRRNPIFGYGSFAKDPEGLRGELCDKYGIDYSVRLAKLEGFTVPAHSVLIGQWNWHGILAGIFWIYYLLLMFNSFRKGIFMLNPQLMGLGIFVSIMMLWEILFSPMAARTPYIFYFIYLIILNTKYKKQLYSLHNDKDINNNTLI